MQRHPSPPPAAPPPRRTRRRGARSGVLLLVALAALLVGPAGIARATAYQYWGYWQLTDGSWGFSQTGPAQSVPTDGSVEGWRWSVDDGTTTRAPRLTAAFEDICRGTAAESGTKRVGVVIDFGRPADAVGTAPDPAVVTRCASVPENATGNDVLAAVAQVRVENALVCGLDGYPASGCAEEVAEVTDAQMAPDTPVTLAPRPSADAASPASDSAAVDAQDATEESTPFWRQPAVLVVAVLAVLAVVVVMTRRRPSGT